MTAAFCVSAVLLGLAGLLIDQHRRAYPRAAAGGDARSRRFAASQYRRRMVGSSTIGVVGALFGVQRLVPETPLWMAVYLAALLGGCMVILLCGLADALAGAKFYRRARLEDRLEQAALAFELERAGADKAASHPRAADSPALRDAGGDNS